MKQQLNKAHIPALALAFLFCFTFYETVASLLEMWTNYGRGYSHGLLLVAISAYLGWDAYKNKPARRTLTALNYIALVTAAGLCLTWLAANLIGISIVQQVLLPLIMLAFITALLGIHYAKIVTFPLLFLYLGMPFWDITNPILQTLTVRAVQFMVNTTDLTAYVHGNYIQIPSGTFKVAQSCAGMRYMLVALTLTILHSYLSFNRITPRLLMVACGLGLSLFANWARVYLIVLIGYKTEMQSSIVNDHETFGWVVFAIALAPMFFTTKFFAKLDGPAQTSQIKVSHSPPITAINSTLPTILASTIMFSILIASKLPTIYTPANSFRLPPATISIWQRSSTQLSWTPHFKNASKHINYDYKNNGKHLGLHVYHYAKQTEDSELISDANHLTKAPWKASEVHQQILHSGETINKTYITNGQSNKLILHWYRIGNSRTYSRTNAKLLQLKGMTQGDFGGSFVAVSLNCGQTARCEAEEWAFDAINRFISSYDEI